MKLFTVVIIIPCGKLADCSSLIFAVIERCELLEWSPISVFVMDNHLHPNLILKAKTGAYPSQALMVGS